ncbi:hypothetical protein O6072_01960 [Mycolicibacterium neoaurum]|uniref:hypothetical protein n=1 Tax=Mycolicibacterium neoaurum TaxID=1795 RepID=UPI00248B8AFD|nr:hypothetical protein [Mycolicibacterium neoaurum]WBP95027.1 hypothetical protein O7W24_02160 [Mycolicibacterium neoaurum]WBS08675.1 hypothetical protein O6072_01960 [Mycolicibacterium neoaurum]
MLTLSDRSALRSRWTVALSAGTGVLLVAAFVRGPAALLHRSFPEYADADGMPDAVTSALTRFLSSSAPALPPELARLCDYWFQWHAIKIGISIALVMSFAILAGACWTRYLGGSGRGAASYGFAANVAGTLAILAGWLLAINIQATAVPLVALLPWIPPGTLPADTLADSPAMTELLEQVSRYHWVLAVGTAALAALSSAGAVASWRRRTTARGRDRRAARMYTALLTVTSLNVVAGLLVAAYSVISAMDPDASLHAILGMG